MVMVQNPVPPVNIPTKMGGAPTPKWDPIGLDNSHMTWDAPRQRFPLYPQWEYLLQKQNSLAQEVLNCTTVQQHLGRSRTGGRVLKSKGQFLFFLCVCVLVLCFVFFVCFFLWV